MTFDDVRRPGANNMAERKPRRGHFVIQMSPGFRAIRQPDLNRQHAVATIAP